MQTTLSSDGTKLLIEVPLAATPPLSKSGKTRLAYSTGSFIKTGIIHPTLGDISVAMNVIVPVVKK